jgi:hypothetical protein
VDDSKWDDLVKISARNLHHVLTEECHDPDCELHHPERIEDDRERLTALAWFLAGAQEGLQHKRYESLKTILANHRLEANGD